MGDYLARIDWGLAIVVALVAGSLGLLLNRFLQASADEFLGVLPWLRARVALSVLNRRRGVPTEPWVCGDCRSLNLPTATLCYHCKRPREAGRLDVEADEPTGPSAGRSTRRG